MRSPKASGSTDERREAASQTAEGPACPETTRSVFQDGHHAARATHYGSLPPKAQHGRPQDENPVVHFFKNIVSGSHGWEGGD